MRAATIYGEQCYEVQPDDQGVLGYFREDRLFILGSSPASTDTLLSNSDDTDDDMESDRDERGGPGTGGFGPHNWHGDSDSRSPDDDLDGAGNIDDWEQIAHFFNFMNCYFLRQGPQLAVRDRRYEFLSNALNNDAEAKAAKAEAEVARLKKKQTSLVDQVCCWTNCCLLSIECLAAMRLFVFTVTSTSTTR